MTTRPKALEPLPPDWDADKLVQTFVQIRDHIAKLEAQMKLKLAPLEKTKEKLEGYILALLDEIGAENIRTTHGTATKTVKYSASLADPEAFMAFVIANNQFDLLDRKANVTAIRAYVEGTTNLPPGVNLTSRRATNVRRAAGT